MVDAKKLITGFLILAAIGSSFSFIFSDFNPTSAISDSQANSLYGKPPAPSPTNAFTEATPQPIESLVNTATSTDDGLLDPSQFGPAPAADNLTADLLKTGVFEVMKKNPDGPVDDGSGNKTISLPDTNQILNKFVSTSGAFKKIQQPDWEAEAAAVADKVSVNEKSTLADEEDYINSLGQIASKLINSRSLNTLNSLGASEISGITSADLDSLGKYATEALTDAKKITYVPEKYAALHKSALKVLVYQKNGVALATSGVGDDPLKAMLVLQAEENNYKASVAELKDELTKLNLLQGQPLSDKEPSAASRVVASFFGVKTAHAQYWDVLANIYHPLLHIFDHLWEELRNALIQVLKNVVFNIMGNQVINWVRGGGTPLFIRNWRGFLRDVYSQTASAALSVLANDGLNLCTPFRSILNIAFRPVNGFNSTRPNFSCTLDRTIANFTGFYNRFQTGGWKAYMSIWRGQNSFWIATIDGRDDARARAAEMARAKENEGRASKGFLGVSVCPANTVPSTSAGMCYDAKGDIDVPMLRTPGDVVGNSVAAGLLHASPENLANANSLSSLVAAFVGNLFNALLSKGLNLL